ncbi:MAG: hypothetical protein NTW10_11020 [Bacteroidetes bacterium]|nr:hypothetical protein [Bacteroidota bacterium]
MLFSLNGKMFAQDTIPKKDSTHLYENIETFSKKSKFTAFLYNQVFRPIEKKSVKKKGYKKLIRRSYRDFEGKMIRNIKIETLDPFSNITADTLPGKQNIISKTGNALHVKTLPITIRNLILIRENHPFDSLLVKESERLIRSQGYVEDVLFFITPASAKSDSVDITIRELDKWSIIPVLGISSTHLSLQLTDKNFLGLGHEIKASFGWNTTNGDNAYGGSYQIPNILNTYINTTVVYWTDEPRNFLKSLSVDRPFFSPYARWAGGVYFTLQFHQDSIRARDSSMFLQNFRVNTQDYWGGFSTPVFKENTEFFRATNFITTLRFLRMRFLEKPVEAIDTM